MRFRSPARSGAIAIGWPRRRHRLEATLFRILDAELRSRLRDARNGGCEIAIVGERGADVRQKLRISEELAPAELLSGSTATHCLRRV